MKPVKNMIPLAKWLLRFALAFIVYEYYFPVFLEFSFTDLHFFYSMVMVICAVTLIIGGIVKKNSTTVISGLIIWGFSIVMLLVNGLDVSSLVHYITAIAIGFYFMARGNWG